ncbi:TolC family protein [Schlesneria paludicola]|uniref:TolC family protein n=1 Tax=Schlesneria paludicola TaxID=360056 RepID=UPI00029A3B94|nr:TolC family protein [Schlesneria paludicola]
MTRAAITEPAKTRLNAPKGQRRLRLVACALTLSAMVHDAATAGEPITSRPGQRKVVTVSARQDKQRDEQSVPPAPTAMPPRASDGAVGERAESAPRGQTQESIATEFRARPELAVLKSLETSQIDLAGAFALIGIQNPQFLAAQQRVLEADAARQLAAVQLLPTINLGMNIDSHQGPVQQSDGNILNVRKDSLYIGAGANAVGAGTVNVPGVVWNLNVSDSIYNYLISRQVQERRAANVTTVSNDVQLQVATAYLNLVRAAELHSIQWQARENVAEVARSTAAFARVGQGRLSDANRAASELSQRDADVIEAESQMVRASARLAALIGLDSAIRLTPTDRWAVPHTIVPEPIPLPELLTIAALQRPELAEQRAEICRTLLALDSAQILPFSPTVLVGISSGVMGGGSDLSSQPVGSSQYATGQDRYGNFASRSDFDVVMFWTLRNLGVGNRAQIDASASRVRQAELQQLMIFDRVRAEVASASVRVRVRFQQLKTAEEAVHESDRGWRQDRQRMWANEGLPIEVLDSQRLLLRSRLALLNSIIQYNIAQFELYQALGQPQAEMLIRSADLLPEVEAVTPEQKGQ